MQHDELDIGTNFPQVSLSGVPVHWIGPLLIPAAAKISTPSANSADVWMALTLNATGTGLCIFEGSSFRLSSPRNRRTTLDNSSAHVYAAPRLYHRVEVSPLMLCDRNVRHWLDFMTVIPMCFIRHACRCGA